MSSIYQHFFYFPLPPYFIRSSSGHCPYLKPEHLPLFLPTLSVHLPATDHRPYLKPECIPRCHSHSVSSPLAPCAGAYRPRCGRLHTVPLPSTPCASIFCPTPTTARLGLAAISLARGHTRLPLVCALA
jgi:hypothetical protein